MIIAFKELKVSTDSKILSISVEVPIWSTEYADYYIESISMCNQDTFTSSTDPLGSIKIFQSSPTDYRKLVSLTIKEGDPILPWVFKDTLFFCYVTIKSKTAPLPTNIHSLKTTMNMYPFYQSTINYMVELNSECIYPKGFTNIILRIKALELCLKTGHYIPAINLWKRFFKGKQNLKPNNICKCNGRD